MASSNTATERSALRVRDKTFIKTDSMPGSDGTVYTTGMDLVALTSYGIRLVDCEFKLSVPTLTSTHLPNDDTLTFSLLTDTVLPIDSSSTVRDASVWVITGATGVAATSKRWKIPSDSPLIIGIKCVAAGTTGDMSGLDFTTEILF